jgi:hypothetical protein
VGLIDRVDRWMWRRPERSGYPLSFQQWVDQFMTYGGQTYQLTGGTLTEPTEKVGAGYRAYVAGAYAGNGVVFACELARMMLFSEARFQWRTMSNGRPGRLFGSPELRPLEEPWPGGTTGDLLTRMILDADFAGNAFVRKVGSRLERMRPDWTHIVYDGDPWEPTTDVLAYTYEPGGPGSKKDPVVIPATEIAHFAPVPDPLSPRKGMSWLTPILREIDSDVAATTHKGALFSKGGTPNMIVKADGTVTKDLFEAVVKAYREGHEDPSNAGKAWFVQAGFDPTVVGSDLQQLDFKATQGAGETRIAAASGIHPVIVGLSEGLQGASLNAGNFNSARRLTADKTLRPLWRNVSGSLEWIVKTPQVIAGRAELWYDDRDIPFVQEDEEDAAKVLLVKAQTIEALIRAGYDPATVADAVESGDLTGLPHTGLVSVQLQEPGADLQNQNGKVPVVEPV